MSTGLHESLEQLVSDVTLPAGFAEGVRLRRRTSRRRRTGVSGLAAVVVFALVLAVTLSLHGPRLRSTLAAGTPPSSTVLASFDGVDLHDLPPGFQATTSSADSIEKPLNSPGNLRVSRILHAPLRGEFLIVEVQRSGPTDLSALATELSQNSARDVLHVMVNGGEALLSHSTKAPIGQTFLEWNVGADLGLALTTSSGDVSDAQLLAVADGMTASPAGAPQPADPAAAIQGIRNAYSTAFGVHDRADRLDAVQFGSALLRQSVSPYEEDLDYRNLPVTAPAAQGEVVFTDASHAVLLWSASTHNDPDGETASGGATLVDGVWKVTAPTWCAAVSDSQCPTAG